MGRTVREVVSESTDVELNVSEYDDHVKVFTNNLLDFEESLLQETLADDGYDSWKFDNDGVQFLKIPLEDG